MEKLFNTILTNKQINLQNTKTNKKTQLLEKVNCKSYIVGKI